MKSALKILIALSFVFTSYPKQAQASIVPRGEQVEVFFQWAKNGGFLGIAKNASGKEVFRIASEATAKETLRKFGPKQLGEALRKAGVGTGSLLLKKLARFPVESLGFFVALGGLMTYNLVFNYAHNPAGYKQLLDSQMDPLGQFAFYSFMVANGAVSEPMMAMIQNGKWSPTLRHFIPYLGMSIGMTASHLVHELGHAKDLHKCVGDMVTFKNSEESCEAAHEAWIERGGLGGLTHELAPSLIGLIGSTVLAGGAQKLGATILKRTGLSMIVKVGTQIAVGSILRLVGVEVATMIVPGGIVIKFIRGAFTFVAQMALFTWVQEAIQPGINHAYHSVVDGKDLSAKTAGLLEAVRDERKAKWKSPLMEPKVLDEDRKKLVIYRLPEFSKKMAEWRQYNMEQPLIVQSNWEQALGRLSSEYRTTKEFYGDLVSQHWQKNNGRYKDLYLSGQETALIDRALPLNGIPTIADTEQDPTMWSQAPDRIEEGQLKYIQHIIGYVEAGVHEALRPMDAINQGYWQESLRRLKVHDATAVGLEIDRIRCLIGWTGRTQPQQDLGEACKIKISAALKTNYYGLLKRITNSEAPATPYWGKGTGYLSAYAKEHPDLEQMNMDKPPASKKNLRSTLDKLVGFALLGPWAGRDKLVIDDMGYPAKFHPPRLVPQVFELHNVNIVSKPKIADMRADLVASIGETRPCVMAFDCLMANLHGEIYQPGNASAFDNWWVSKVEPEYLKAWLKFEDKYQYNIGLLKKSLFQERSLFNNKSPISNAVMASYIEEARIYSLLLNVLFMDELTKGGKTIPPLMMRQAFPSQFEGYVPPPRVVFNWLAFYLREMERISDKLNAIKIVKITNNAGKAEEMPVSSFSNAEFENHVNEMKKQVNDMASFVERQENMAPYQKMLAQTALNSMTQLAVEVGGLSMVINTASYRERHEVGGYASPRCEAIKKSNAMGAGARLEAMIAGCENEK